MRKTKIIATLGPASFNPQTISALIENGMDTARINMSHYNSDIELEKHIVSIRELSKEHNRSVSILFDLCGPKIRVGKLKKTIKVTEGDHYTLGSNDCDIPISMDLTFTDNSSSGIVKINDGKITFKIIDVKKKKLKLIAIQGGDIVTGKGINFPGVELDMPSLTNKDIDDLKLAVKLRADWIAMSFVRSAEDYLLIKSELDKLKVDIPIIAKIEKPEAIINLVEIICEL